MKPSIGRIVHFYTDDRHEPAIITRVWSDTCVNLKVLPDCAAPFDQTSVCLNDASSSSWWSWPPREG